MTMKEHARQLQTTYKNNVWLQALCAPFAGALFLMFLPAVGFYLFFGAIFSWLYRRLQTAFIPQPMAAGEAHLTGEPPTGQEDKEELQGLYDEIQDKRK